MTDRAASIHTARVYLAQSRHFTGRARGFSFVLLGWAANARRRAMAIKPALPVQGNLDPRHMVTGGQALIDATRDVVRAFASGPHIFNLGHGITPDADPANVALMIETIRNG